MKRFALKGINDEAQTCAICGRVELKRVMWLVELAQDGSECGEAFHCGTTCGAKLLGYTQSAMSTKVKNYKAEVARRRYQIERNHPANVQADELIRQLNALNLFGAARFTHPLFAQMSELHRIAHEYAEAQIILIEA